MAQPQEQLQAEQTQHGLDVDDETLAQTLILCTYAAKGSQAYCLCACAACMFACVQVYVCMHTNVRNSRTGNVSKLEQLTSQLSAQDINRGTFVCLYGGSYVLV